MFNANNGNSLSPTRLSGVIQYELNGTEDRKELIPLAAALISVNNSSHEPNKENNLNRISNYLNQVWEWLHTTSNSQASLENGNNEEGTELLEILKEGENLRWQAYSLRASKTEESAPHSGESSLLKRWFVGIGLMSAAGYTIYKYYNAGAADIGSLKNALQPSSTPPDPINSDGSHGGNLEYSFGNHSLHHDDPVNRTRHERRHIPLDTTPSTPLQINAHDDMGGLLQMCYKYISPRLTLTKKRFLCADEINAYKMLNNKQLGQSPYPYIYTTEQHRKCKTKNHEDECERIHKDYHKEHPSKKMSNLVRNVGETPCLCPHPVGDNVYLIFPELQKKNTEKGTLTSSTKMPERTNPLHKKSYFFSPDYEKTIARGDTASSVAPSDGRENIKIEKMYDLSCIDERNNMSLTDIMRQVGKTLQSPVYFAFKEAQIVYNYNILKKGCSPKHESQRAEKVTKIVDVILSQALSLLPGSNALVITQSIIGPLLEGVADGLDGKPADPDKVSDLQQQISFFLKQYISFIKTEDMIKLYDKHTESVEKNLEEIYPQRKRFILKDDGLYIPLDGEQYKIIPTNSGAIFIQKNGEIKRVYFNKEKNSWMVFSQNGIVFLPRQDLIENYGAELSKSLWIKDAEINLSKSNSKIMEIENNGIMSKYVIINDFLIHIEEKTFDNELTTIVAVSEKVSGKKVIIEIEDGWQFEQDSTNYDENLKSILDSIENKGLEYSGDNKFTFIKGDYFSYDNSGVRYLKHKGMYYKVSEHAPSAYSLHDAPNNYFVIENQIFKTISSADLLCFNGEVSVGAYQTRDDTNLYLERAAYDLLINQGIPLSDAKPADRVGPGVYVDKNYGFIFSANDKYFLMESYTGGDEIVLKRKVFGSKNIKLFRHDDTFLKVRDEKNLEIEYKKIKDCRGVRSPTLMPSSCQSLWMEEELDSILKKSISSKLYSKKSVIDTSISTLQRDFFPNLVYSLHGGNLFYLHDGQYFYAQLSPIKGSVKVLKVFTSRSFFRKKELITYIISEKKGNIIELKTLSGYLSERTNVRKWAAQQYINNKKYKSISNIKSIEGVVEQLNLSGEFFFPPIKLDISPTMSSDYINRRMYGTYPSRISQDENCIIKAIKAKDFKNEEQFHLRAGALKVRNYVNFIKEDMFQRILKEIKLGNKQYDHYVRVVFNTEDAGFVSAFLNEITKIIKQIDKNLDMDNIHVFGVYRKKFKANRVRYDVKEYLTEDERRTGTFAFAISDESKRIYLSIDKLYFIEHSLPDDIKEGVNPINTLELEDEPAMELGETLLHEASHINGMTWDYVYFPLEEKSGRMEPILDSVDFMVEKIRKWDIEHRESFKKMTADYINSIPLLRNAIPDELTSEHLYYLALKDKMYLSHLLLKTADANAILIRDLYTIARSGKIIE